MRQRGTAQQQYLVPQLLALHAALPRLRLRLSRLRLGLWRGAAASLAVHGCNAQREQHVVKGAAARTPSNAHTVACQKPGDRDGNERTSFSCCLYCSMSAACAATSACAALAASPASAAAPCTSASCRRRRSAATSRSVTCCCSDWASCRANGKKTRHAELPLSHSQRSHHSPVRTRLSGERQQPATACNGSPTSALEPICCCSCF